MTFFRAPFLVFENVKLKCDFLNDALYRFQGKFSLNVTVFDTRLGEGETWENLMENMMRWELEIFLLTTF